MRARPAVAAGVAMAVVLLQAFLPAVVLSIARKPWTFFTFNPWLAKLPEYAVSAAPLPEKLGFLSRVALFWFSADGAYGAPEWGYAVDMTDIARFVLIAVLIGVYTALWLASRDGTRRSAWRLATGRSRSFVGAFASVLGLSTSPCSVVGCGAPVLPVVALVFTGLSSGTLALLSGLSRLMTVVVVLALLGGIAYVGSRVGEAPSRRIARAR